MRDDGAGHPFYFRSSDHGLLGHWHPARGPARPLAVVLCATVGREELSAYPTLKALADRLAATGFHVLRFDYPACGDSGGDEEDAALVASWIASIDAATDELRRLSGAPRVALVGLRVGALLAAQVAARREDVAGLGALVPVLSGRRHLRELRMLAAAAIDAGGDARSSGDRDLDAGGHWLSADTCAALGRLALSDTPRPRSDPVLIVEADDLPIAGDWAVALDRAGCAVELRAVPGIAQMMQDAHLSRVPDALLEVATAWLLGVDADAADAGERATGDATPARSMADAAGADTPSVAAAALPRRGIFGGCLESIEEIDCGAVRIEAILSAPLAVAAADGSDAARLPPKVVVIPNAGAVRRSGPGRLQTQLARELARRGCVVMRADLSGFGDSAPLEHPTGHPVYFPEAQTELATLCEWLRDRTGARTCVVIGLCSGEYHGLRAAMSSATIHELIAVNPLTFHWHEGDEMLVPDYKIQGEVRRYLQPKGQLTRLRKLLRGQVNVRKSLDLLRRHARSGLHHAGRDVGRLLGWPLRDDLARDLAGMLDRGVRVRFLIAKSDPGVDMLRREGGLRVRRWLRRGRIRLDILENADHTFTRRESKQRLLRAVTQALQGHSDERRDERLERRCGTPVAARHAQERPPAM